MRMMWLPAGPSKVPCIRQSGGNRREFDSPHPHQNMDSYLNPGRFREE